MNELNKTDLREILRCLKYMTNGGVTPYSCHTISLVKKLKAMIDNYCEHDYEYFVHTEISKGRQCLLCKHVEWEQK